MRKTNVVRQCEEAGIPVGPHGGLLGHDYQRDTCSGAGNCICGGDEKHRMHNQYSPEGDLEVEGMPVLLSNGTVRGS